MAVLLLLTLGVFLIACGMFVLRTHRAQQANIANFMVTLTHDGLSNPIQSAQAATDNLEREFKQFQLQDDTRFARSSTTTASIEDLKHSLGRLSATAHNLRHLALLEIEQNAILNERINLVSIAQHLVLELGPTAETTGVRLLYEGKNKAIYLLQQPEFVRNILKNILQNAIKYTVGHSDACVVLSVSEQAENAVVAISDNGTGINAQQLKSLTMHPQRPTARNIAKKGNGLGLYLVKRLVDQCGGTMDITSEIDKGTTVTILLPAVAAVE